DQNAFSNIQNGPEYDAGFVGPGINHLQPLGNEDYRFNDIPPRPLDGGLTEIPPPRNTTGGVPVPVQVLNINGREDEPLAGNIFPNGLPPGGSVRNVLITTQPTIGTVTINDDGDFTISVPPHYSGLVTFTYSYVDSAGQTRTDTVAVPVTPVVDPASSSVGPGAFVSDEDNAATLSGLTAELVDRDGSEQLTRISIDGVPPGYRFTDAAGNPLGVDIGGGVWLFQPGDVERLRIVPPTHEAADLSLRLSVTSTEMATGESATVSNTFTVSFRPVADAPAVTVGPGTFTAPEDNAVVLGGLSVSLVDQDGSESLSRPTISGVPAGVVFTDASGNPVGVDLGGGVWSFTPAELATLRLVAPTHVSGVIDLVLSATATEGATGGSATTNVPFRVTLSPVADAPVASVGAGAFSGPEDTRIALPGLSAALVDVDGSETLASLRLTGVPAGARFTDASGSPIGVDLGGGVWSFTPAELALLHIELAPNASGTFTLQLEATARETANGDEATTRIPLTLNVTAVADQANVPDTGSRGDEDTAIGFGSAITYSLADTDGSEAVTEVRLSGFPAGGTVNYVTAP
ncbi:MAG: Ig-like domain-containing protein, partial [Beijerinckiaceae bacterium]